MLVAGVPAGITIRPCVSVVTPVGRPLKLIVTELVLVTTLPLSLTPVSTLLVVPPLIPLGTVSGVTGVTVKLPVPITKVLVTVWQLVGFSFSHTL